MSQEEISLSLGVRDGKIGFWGNMSGIVVNGPSYGVSNGDVTLTNFRAPVTMHIKIAANVDYVFDADPHKSLAIGPAADGPPVDGHWDPEFEHLSVSDDRKTLTFIDDFSRLGSYEYTITVWNTTTNEKKVIDPKIRNKGQN